MDVRLSCNQFGLMSDIDQQSQCIQFTDIGSYRCEELEAVGTQGPSCRDNNERMGSVTARMCGVKFTWQCNAFNACRQGMRPSTLLVSGEIY